MKILKGMQGDVQFSTIKSIPSAAVKISNKPLAYGEVSGHQHVLTGDVQLFELEGRIIAAVGSDGARLQHVHESNFNSKLWATTEEIQKSDHGSLLLPEGNYEFWIQNAYNPFAKIFKKVID